MPQLPNTAETVTIRRALVSVTDKDSLEELKPLIEYEHGGLHYSWEFISTGGTQKALEALGIPVTPIEKYTGFPEMMGGRLKTLHPKVFGGILADRNNPEHMKQAAEHGIEMIDLVVVNLYDFAGKPGIEQIDIGGPSLLRAAAKNCKHVAVLCRPDDYALAVERLLKDELYLTERIDLALTVFDSTSEYDFDIMHWMAEQVEKGTLAETAPPSH